jgi:lipopolysaccharide biosynthesis regulator YciM
LLGALDREDVAAVADLFERIAGLESAVGDEAGARASFLEVLRVDAYRESALAPLVDLHERAGEWREAAAGLERLAGLAADTATRVARLERLAEIQFSRLGDAQRAVEILLRAADLAEDPGPVLLHLVDLHWETGDLESVVELAAEIERTVEDPGPQRAARLAIALAVRGRHEEARRHVAGSLVEAIAEALCDAVERGIEPEAALPDLAPRAADRKALFDVLRDRPGATAERVRAMLPG